MINLPPWMAEHERRLEGAIAAGRLPHALMLHGPDGSGRRLLAMWLATQLFGKPDAEVPAAAVSGRDIDLAALPAMPDLAIVQPEPDKQRIGIEAVRALVASMQLTSHQSGWKLGLIWPAHRLTDNAADALLKTLEEPPAGSLIMLITDSVSALPATIVSRCQRLRVPLPPADQAQAWLRREAPSVDDWTLPLELACGAPLRALHEHETGRAEQAAELERDVERLTAGECGPRRIAERWARRDPEFCLNWLYSRAGREIRGMLAGDTAGKRPDSPPVHLQNPGKPLNIDRWFGYLGEIAELRRLAGSGINTELNLMLLLSRWQSGFQSEKDRP